MLKEVGFTEVIFSRPCSFTERVEEDVGAFWQSFLMLMMVSYGLLVGEHATSDRLRKAIDESSTLRTGNRRSRTSVPSSDFKWPFVMAALLMT